jgi:chloride channel protein, CIC family
MLGSLYVVIRYINHEVSVPSTVRDGRHLVDFSATPRILLIAGLALAIGAVAAVVSWVLVRLIGLITNAVFYQRPATGLVAPGAVHHSPFLILLAPVVGGLVIGLMARYGSEKIRGHGMPEAIESILMDGSRVAPRVALLKPVSSAVAIGTGGPFGAEGPIIMTGGAVGSLFAQLLHLTADERKTLLVAGATAGMAATFNAPLASILLAAELLLFELRPLVIAATTAYAVSTHTDQPLRHVAELMAWHDVTAIPVLDRGDSERVVGIVTLPQLLAGRARDQQEARERERLLRVRLVSPTARTAAAGRV